MTDEHKLIMKFLSEKALADYKAKLGSIIELRKIRVYTGSEFEDLNFIEPRRFTVIKTDGHDILREHGDYIDPLYKVTPAEKYPDLDKYPKYIEFFTDDLLSYALEDWTLCPNCHHIHNINGGETK